MTYFPRTPGYMSGNIFFLIYPRRRHQKEKAIFSILLPEILYPTLPLTWLPITRHTLLACPSKVLTTQRMHRWRSKGSSGLHLAAGELSVVSLLELALPSSEEPATGTGPPVTGDMRQWWGYHQPRVKPSPCCPGRDGAATATGKPCRKVPGDITWRKSLLSRNCNHGYDYDHNGVFF